LLDLTRRYKWIPCPSRGSLTIGKFNNLKKNTKIPKLVGKVTFKRTYSKEFNTYSVTSCDYLENYYTSLIGERRTTFANLSSNTKISYSDRIILGRKISKI